MTEEQMERAIEFLLSSQAQNATDIGKLTADVQGIKEAQAQTSHDVMTLAAVVSELTSNVSRLEVQAENDRAEIREAIDKLILANEITRDFANQIAKLEVQTSQRVTGQGKEIASLVDQGKETSAHLNILINIVERHLTNPKAHDGEQ